MTKSALDVVEGWLASARAVAHLCTNRDAFEELILAAERRRDAIEESLSDQWAVSNGLEVIHP